MTSRTITWLFIDDQERRAREAIQRKLTLTHGSGAAIATSSYSAGPQVPRYSGARQFLGPLRQAFHDGESFVPHHIHLVQGGCGGPGRHAEGLQGRRGAESEVEQAAWETETIRAGGTRVKTWARGSGALSESTRRSEIDQVTEGRPMSFCTARGDKSARKCAGRTGAGLRRRHAR